MVIHFFQVCFGRNGSSNRRRMLTKWFEGFFLSFLGWKVRVDGRDLVLFCVVVFSNVMLEFA